MKNCLEENQKVVFILNKLLKNPPRVLVIEGGGMQDREEIANYWCMLLNCRQEDTHKPCFECKICRDILQHRFPDVILLNGKDGTIKKDHVEIIQREKDIPPREGSFKIVLFNEAQNLSLASANSLLKILEEPKDKNLFVLLVPYKMNLLPTILSRSFILTLKWKHSIFGDEKIYEIIDVLLNFWKTGKGLFEITQKKIERDVVRSIIFFIQQDIFNAMSGDIQDNLSKFFYSKVHENKLWKITHLLDKSLEMLVSNVSSSAVLEWMALHLFYIFSK